MSRIDTLGFLLGFWLAASPLLILWAALEWQAWRRRREVRRRARGRGGYVDLLGGPR